MKWGLIQPSLEGSYDPTPFHNPQVSELQSRSHRLLKARYAKRAGGMADPFSIVSGAAGLVVICVKVCVSTPLRR